MKIFVPTLKSPYSHPPLHGVPIQMSIRNKRGLALREIVPQAIFFLSFSGGTGGGGQVVTSKQRIPRIPGNQKIYVF